MKAISINYHDMEWSNIFNNDAAWHFLPGTGIGLVNLAIILIKK